MERYFKPKANATAASGGTPTRSHSLQSNNNNPKAKRQRKSSQIGTKGGPLDKFVIKRKSSDEEASSSESNENSSARRRLDFSSSSQQPKRKKKKAQIQQSIGKMFDPSVGQKPRANFLGQEYPDPLSHPADHRVTEIQFRRDALTVAPAIQQPMPRLQLNAEQQRVVDCPPDVTLSVRAGAGTGKTRAMVHRAVSLINNYNFDPTSILMITFSNKAAEEIRERITAELSSNNDCPDEDLNLPTMKTFHGLAFSWLLRCWKACGLGKFPTPLATKSAQRRLMKLAIEENLDGLRLERCHRMLWREEDRPAEVSWELVVKTFKARYSDEYNTAFEKADERAHKDLPDEKKIEKMTAEEQAELHEETKASRSVHLRRECYLQLLGCKKTERKGKAEDKDDDMMEALGIDGEIGCDLERRWSGDKKQCDMYLELVNKARLGQHSKGDYLPEDAKIWELYDKLQRETGRIDFDTMLILFTEEVLSNEALAQRFHEKYRYVIVDEYQDNSEAQALMLNKIVERGSLTVVGDDDQCIYQFRGASPGNFKRLKESFLEDRQITVCEETLTENYRSSANILSVAATFLKGDNERLPKILRPTKAPGLPVEIWKCHRKEDQAMHIVQEMIKRHEEESVPWDEMACLFRCFKYGQMGSLTTDIQRLLAKEDIPFRVVGGTTIFERETVLDLMAYLRLSTGSYDDDSFERVINKPTRRLPKEKILPLIKEQVKRSSSKTPTISLQEAALKMCKTGLGLSSSQHKALKEFLDLIDGLQDQVNSKPLPDLLRLIWKETHLNDFHYKKGNNGSKKEGKKKSAKSPAAKTGCPINYCPVEIKSVIELAERHVNEWKRREAKVIADCCKSKNKGNRIMVPSLVDLSRAAVMRNISAMKIHKLLPAHIVDEIILAPSALGRAVIHEFLACAALQQSVDNEDPSLPGDVNGKVSISTIHRSKGLEFSDVYVPYFNQGFMPTDMRDDDAEIEDDDDDNDGDEAQDENGGRVDDNKKTNDDGGNNNEDNEPKDNNDSKNKAHTDNDKRNRGRRHLPDCSAIRGDRCDKQCIRYFQEADNKRLGGTAETRHLNEERRLAHVAATRAKNKLVFTIYTQPHHWRDKPQESPFMNDLRGFSKSVVKVVTKTWMH